MSSLHHAVLTSIENPGPLAVASKWKAMFSVFTLTGIVTFAAGLMIDSTRIWHDYILAYYIFTCFGLGGLFFAALHHATNATWSVIPRRVGEGFASFLPVSLILFIGVAVGLYTEGGHLYEWLNGGVFKTHSKEVWFTPEFFIIRNVAFLLMWIVFYKFIVGWSIKQDDGSHPELSNRLPKISIGFLLILAPTFTVMCIDLMKSQQPHWFSTMWGVYCFAGLFQSTVALMILVFVRLRKGILSKLATPSHVKDLSGLLFAFTIFMCYVGFSQFMLIWYANLPEETIFFIQRMQYGWGMLFLVITFMKFVIPFFGLMGQGQKKSEGWLKIVCWIVLIGQFLDFYWVSFPTFNEHFTMIGWMEIGMLIGFAGIFGLTVSRFFGKYSIAPTGDPKALESANWRFWE
jgi:hypothetical protein